MITHAEIAEYDKWMAELAAEDAAWNEIAGKIDAENTEWKKKWPKHCTHCGGWGMFVGYQSVPYGSTSASFEVQDPCDHLPENVCHRCGEAGLDQDSNGPCSHCGWNFDDGIQKL